ncbi:MAG: hypothetical protein WBP93_16865 [Pyrinomonadaceae bacterium]
MRKLYKQALWIAVIAAALISSYLFFQSVIANPLATQRHARAATEEPGGLRVAAQNGNLKDMYAQTLARIKGAREARDINGLVRLGDEIEATWSKLDATRYASLMLEVCNAFSSTDLNDDNQYVQEQKYALLVLNKRLVIPANIEAQLVLHLQEDIEYGKGQLSAEKWMENRRNKAELWLRTWQHLNASIIPNFDFKDLPLENVAPPPGVAGVAGMSPDAIKDPALRARYQRAVDSNNRKAENYRAQSALYKTREIFRDRMEAYLIRSYSRPPDNTKEIEAILKKHSVDEGTRAKILDKVKFETSELHSD